MSDGGNRIGTVSSVDAKTGMVSVIFNDRDNEVTELLPYATFNEEYKLPQIGAKVVVLHLNNGGEMGIILGTYWNEYNAAGDPGTFHKDLGGGAYINYKDGVLTVAAEHTIIASLDGGETYQEVEAEKLLQKVHDHEKRIAALEKAVGVGKGAVEWP
nr:MAG TPA: baseplate assembly protein V [Caudoviricetes sp.]